jgi:hypothetical protein
MHKWDFERDCPLPQGVEKNTLGSGIEEDGHTVCLAVWLCYRRSIVVILH